MCLFQCHMFLPKQILHCVFLGCSVWTSTLILKHHRCSGKEPSLESRWALSGQSCLPSEAFRPPGCNGSCMMPIAPCNTTSSLWDMRSIMGHLWEDLTLAEWVLDNGNPELFFYRYVDTNVKDDPSYLWYNLTDSIISIFNLSANSPISLLS